MPRDRSLPFRVAIVPLGAVGVLAGLLVARETVFTRAAALVVLFVLAADLASLARGRMQNALVVLATLLLGMAAIEAVAQAKLPHVVVKHPRALWTDRPELGWGPKAGGAFQVEKLVDGRSIYKVTYTIDDDLLRHTSGPASGPTIGFLGDSFTFGEGLNDPDTIAQAFADAAPGLHILNLAFSAYSPSQALRALEIGLFDKVLGSPRALILQTGPWHAERTACKPNFSIRAPRYLIVDGELRYEGPCASGLRRRLEELYKGMASYRLLLAPLLQRPTHTDLDIYLKIVAAVARLAHDKYHAPLILLYVRPTPHYLDGTGFTDAEIRARMTAAGVHIVDGTLEAKPGEVLTIAGDGHPNGAANRRLAERLVDDIRRTMPEALKPPAATARQ